MIAPYRANGALVAKQAATVHHLSGGRLVLGAAVGGREDDYTASGRRLPHARPALRRDARQWGRIWAGEDFGTAGAIGPVPPGGGPPVLIGGRADVAFERAARHGDGWAMGGGDARRSSPRAPPSCAPPGRRPGARASRARSRSPTSRSARARRRRPTAICSTTTAFLGDAAAMVAGSAATDAATVARLRGGVRRQAGCDELVLFPCDPDPDQVDLLADAVFHSG